jgi:hypothetical protein
MTALGSNIGYIYTIFSWSRRKKLCRVYRVPFVVLILHTPLAVGYSTVIDSTLTSATRVVTPLGKRTTSSRPFLGSSLRGLFFCVHWLLAHFTSLPKRLKRFIIPNLAIDFPGAPLFFH